MKNKLKKTRPPVVVVLGHVDHGKTTLLDYIRKTSVALKEAGGITQSIGAYEAEHNGRKITFIDTPGHEAFSKMRERCSKIADVAILLVATDSGVQPQTVEAIKIIKTCEIPYVVALNKIDKASDKVEKVKGELMAENVLLEGYGGDVSFQPISAKTGEGVNELLDLVVLASDLENLEFNEENPGSGFILESHMDSSRGIVAVGIVTDGILKTGDNISAGKVSGKIRFLENFLGKRIISAAPSEPVLILGFTDLPLPGELFKISGTESEPAINREENFTNSKKALNLPEFSNDITDKIVLNVILRADVYGSLEVVRELISDIPKNEKILIRIIDENVGNVTDGDVKLAISTKSVIVNFKSAILKQAQNLAEIHNVKIISSDIVYKLVEKLENELKFLGKDISKGDLEILATFRKKDSEGQVVGGKVLEGAIINNSNLEIRRGESLLGNGKIINLQHNKKDVSRVEEGNECGLLFNSKIQVKAGDHLLLK